MIPQGRLSTEPVPGAFREPENRRFYSLISYEKGPIAIEDTSEGLLYQNWTLTWDANTNVLTAYPETTQVAQALVTVATLVSVSFTFDQNGRISFAYTTPVSSFLYWFDTSLGQTVTTDLGADCITPALYLDDKRVTQNPSSDMMLWYTKADGGGTYSLYSLLQRERFTIEYLMATGLSAPYIHNIGMSSELRVQILLKGGLPIKPIEPPADPFNYTFESGDLGWYYSWGPDWSIQSSFAYAGAWSALLNTIPATYSEMACSSKEPVIAGQTLNLSCYTYGPGGTTVAIGFEIYDINDNGLGSYALVVDADPVWTLKNYALLVTPPAAAYARVAVKSNASTGPIYLDNIVVDVI